MKLFKMMGGTDGHGIYRPERPTSAIVYMSGDVNCSMVAADEQSRSMLLDAAAIHPAIRIISNEGDRVVATFPWSWLRIKVPLNYCTGKSEDNSDTGR